MNDLAIHIEYLLLSHNCVIVPKLGAFRADNTPAKWIDSENLYMPPIRNVHFNPLINVDKENILIDSIAEIFHLSQEEAEKQCNEMVGKFHNTLMSEGTLDFGSIGVFTYEEDGTITMDSCECGVINPSYYGIDALHLQKLENAESTEEAIAETVVMITPESVTEESHETIAETIPETVIEEKTETVAETTPETVIEAKTETAAETTTENEGGTTHVRRTPTRPTESHLIFSISRKLVNYSIAVASVIALIFIIKPTEIKTYAGTPANGQQTTFIRPNMALDVRHTATQTNGYESELKDSFDAVLLDITEEADNEGFSMNESTESEAETNTDVQSKEIVKTPVVSDNSAETKASNYCIVLASCVSRANAESFVNSLNKRNIKATIMEKNDLRRVVVEGFSTQEEAYKYIRTIKQNNDDISSAWVLKL